MTKRQIWAMKRNWLLLRLRGARSVFSYSSRELIHSLIPSEDWRNIGNVDNGLRELIDKISESKYKED